MVKIIGDFGILDNTWQEAVVNYVRFLDNDFTIRNLYNNDKETPRYYVSVGKKYLKLSTTSAPRLVHSFILLDYHKKFEEGDILKPSNDTSPVGNFVRGNIFLGNYGNITWSGAH